MPDAAVDRVDDVVVADGEPDRAVELEHELEAPWEPEPEAEPEAEAPADEGAVIRCALDSIALKSHWVLEGLERLVGGRLETIHIVGGGAHNRELCQAIADACQRRVVAGPVEATALGNCMVQAIAAGAVGSIAEARDVVRRSFPVDEYLPRDSAAWQEAYSRFLPLAN